MVIKVKKNKIDGLNMRCNGKLVGPNGGNDGPFPTNRTPRFNSSFHKSKRKTGWTDLN